MMLTNLRLSILPLTFFAVFALFFISCAEKPEKISVIFDTDTNNELDDQHALAYLLFNEETFDIRAVTVNTTRGGGRIAEQMAEAARVIALCGKSGSTTLLPGADASFNDIVNFVGEPVFDGSEAVDRIIDEAKKMNGKKLTVIAVGKLTNPALALAKAPEISKMIRLVWLGANYPDPGEYNLENDTAALNYVLSSDVPFEIALVRYGKGNGTDAVRVTQEEIHQRMPGKGPSVTPPVTGRHGGEFTNFGDYSVNLFDHINLHGADKSRALFDMAAVAIVKNPVWASSYDIPAPRYVNNQWIEQPDNQRKITIWEKFNKEAILTDFFGTF